MMGTYRLQLSYKFTFKDVALRLPYFKKLGISTLYFSPILQAERRSLHGYNIIDFKKVNLELGGVNEFKKLASLAKKYGISILLDFVPNHMATASPWWKDVERRRSSSPYFKFFDIRNGNEKKISYRRFFDIDQLVCLNVENKNVFTEIHDLIFKLLKYNVGGLRIDHIDGLHFPEKYLKNLKSKTKLNYIIVEKILAREEKLNSLWPVQGTTGYDFLNAVNQLYVYPHGLKKIKNFYRKNINPNSIESIRYQSNKLVIDRLFKNEFDFLLTKLKLLSEKYHLTFRYLSNCLLEFSANIPIYRTYLENGKISKQDSKFLFNTLKYAKLRTPYFSKELNRFYKYFILNKINMPEWLNWIQSWQVFTAPLVAKGFEDTTCYLYNAFISLNEVGSDPEFFNKAGNLIYFHKFNGEKSRRYACCLNALSTHDTKHSEDIRARLNVLSELDGKWLQYFDQWQKLNITTNHPEKSIAFMIFQILLSSWPLYSKDVPLYKKRLINFIIKALRETKLYSSWKNPNLIIEKNSVNFIEKILSNKSFLKEFLPFQKKIAYYGMLNSLSQLTLKLTSPGIPDTYQGNELFRFDLVDPDNRRSIDFNTLNIKLNRINKYTINKRLFFHLTRNWQNSEIKLFLTQRLLKARKDYQELFLKGHYQSIKTYGVWSNHVVAFRLSLKKSSIIVIAPRWYTYLVSGLSNKLKWKNTGIIITPGVYKSLITNTQYNLKTRCSLGTITDLFPVNVLISI